MFEYGGVMKKKKKYGHGGKMEYGSGGTMEYGYGGKMKYGHGGPMSFMEDGMEAMMKMRGKGSEDRNYAGQYMGRIQEDKLGKFAEYEALDGSKTKAYIPDNMNLGEVGDYVPDMDFRILEVGGRKVLAMKER